MRISEAAKRLGTSARMLRYREELGLLPQVRDRFTGPMTPRPPRGMTGAEAGPGGVVAGGATRQPGAGGATRQARAGGATRQARAGGATRQARAGGAAG